MRKKIEEYLLYELSYGMEVHLLGENVLSARRTMARHLNDRFRTNWTGNKRDRIEFEAVQDELFGHGDSVDMRAVIKLADRSQYEYVANLSDLRIHRVK